MAKHDHGEVEFEMGDSTYTLEPTLAAMKNINRRFGDLRTALQRVGNLDFEATAYVIAEGAGANKRQARQVEEDLFAEGLPNVVGYVSDYLAGLLNPGGDEPEEKSGKSKKSRRNSTSKSTTSSDSDADG